MDDNPYKSPLTPGAPRSAAADNQNKVVRYTLGTALEILSGIGVFAGGLWATYTEHFIGYPAALISCGLVTALVSGLMMYFGDRMCR